MRDFYTSFVFTINVEGVVVEAGVAEQAVPLPPPSGYAATIVLVQVLPEVPGRVPAILKRIPIILNLCEWRHYTNI